MMLSRKGTKLTCIGCWIAAAAIACTLAAMGCHQNERRVEYTRTQSNEYQPIEGPDGRKIDQAEWEFEKPGEMVVEP